MLACVLSGACASTAYRSPELGPVDAGIASEVWHSLGTKAGVDVSALSVVTRNGVVTLRGTMTSLDDLRRALGLVSRIRGVRQVVNQVRIVDVRGLRGA